MADTHETFHSLLRLAIENGASDIHIKSNKSAMFRLNGRLEPVDMDALAPEAINDFVENAMPSICREGWEKARQADFSYVIPGDRGGRFRVNSFHQRGTPSIVFRHIKDTPPSFEDLNHDPDVFRKLCGARDGIILVCGPTGSGKSSTLAAMLDYINHQWDRHIVTLEDPIEFTYTDDKSVFNQREIGIDTPSFELGMKAVLRQDPDVILIGEMRDRDTFETALHAAETGHLVLGTLHASNAQQAVQRLFEFFPPEIQPSMHRQVAEALRATITQKLIPSMDDDTRVPAVEMFVVDVLAKKTISEGSFEKIPQIIEAGEESGSKTFNKDLHRLIKESKISKQDGLAFSPNPKALEMNLKGIFLSSGGIVG